MICLLWPSLSKKKKNSTSIKEKYNSAAPNGAWLWSSSILILINNSHSLTHSNSPTASASHSFYWWLCPPIIAFCLSIGVMWYSHTHTLLLVLSICIYMCAIYNTKHFVFLSFTGDNFQLKCSLFYYITFALFYQNTKFLTKLQH